MGARRRRSNGSRPRAGARACAGSSIPNTTDPSRPLPSRPNAGSSPFTASTVSTASRRRGPPALGHVLELAVAISWSRKRLPSKPRGRTRRTASGNAASSTSNRPSCASRWAKSVEATPRGGWRPNGSSEPVPCLEDLRDHRRRRRLAVRGRDDRRAGQACGERVDCARIEQSSFPGSVCRPLPWQVGRACRCAGGEGLGCEAGAHRPRGYQPPPRTRPLGPSCLIVKCSRLLAWDDPRRHPAVAGIDPEALAAFQAGIRSATRTTRSSRGCATAQSDSGVRRRCASSPRTSRRPCTRRR